MNPLTTRQQAILTAVIDQIEKTGYPPSMREIARMVDLRSTASVYKHMKALEKAGYVRRDPSKPRAIEVLLDANGDPFHHHQKAEKVISLPVIDNVLVGQSIFAEENIRMHLSFSEQMVPSEHAYLLTMSDDSLKDIGIMPADLLLIEPQTQAKAGDVVVVLKGNGIVCRIYQPGKKGLVKLETANEAVEPLWEENPMVIGRVAFVIRNMNKRSTTD